MTAKEESYSTAAGSGSRIDDSSKAGSATGSQRADIDSVKSTGVLSATGVLSDSDMDRQVTQRASRWKHHFVQQNGNHLGRFPFHKYDVANEDNHHIGGLADVLVLDSGKQYTLQTC